MQPHERLDAALTRRIDELDLTWAELASASGVHEVTLRALRRGENKPSARTKRRLEDALKWERGSVDTVLAGNDPVPVTRQRPPTLDETQAIAETNRYRAERLLANYQALDESRQRMAEELMEALRNASETHR